MIIPDPSPNGDNTLLAEALRCHRRGWCVIPTKGKKPACRWKQFQSDRPTKAQLRDLFATPGIDGLAVVMGPVSGGLVCRDFDDLDAYKRWRAKYPKLAARLPTVRTARGRHVYFVGPEGFQDCGDGEYRGTSGQYVLLPPSRHPDGHVYRWKVPLPDDDIPRLVDPFKSGLASEDVTQRSQREENVTQRDRMLPREPRDYLLCSLGNISDLDREAVESAIAETQPRMVGQRHRMVFELCRRLKGIRALAKIETAEIASLRSIVKAWHAKALPVIGTKPFSETWADFISGWAKVRHAVGHGPIDRAFRRALKRRPPKRAVKLYGVDDPAVKLAALCRELQRGRADGEFFHLDCRTVGRLLDVSAMTASRLLSALVVDGILVAGEKGSRAKHKASEFCYVRM